MKYQEDIDKAKNNQEEFRKLMAKLKKKKPKQLDVLFHQEHDRVFEEIDCLECANCCKTTSPIFRDIDVARISKKFKTSSEQFEKQYLRRDEDGDLVLKESPCAFLEADNKCFIYDVRPQACREYPHTNRKRMSQILELTRKNTEVCPAVSKIVHHIQKDLG